MSLITQEEESLILSALRRAYNQSQFWRERLIDQGIRDSDLIPGFDFHSLPLLTKHELLKDQAEHGPFGRLLAVDPSAIRRIHKTSGTTATPLFIGLTDRDISDTYMASQRAFRAAGMGSQDRVVHCLNFNMWSGGLTDYIPVELVGATGIPFGVGNTPLLLRTILTLKINAISSTPSYMFALRDRCRDELGIDPRDLGLRRGYFGGEGILQIPGVRQDIEATFGMVAIDANYGMSEVTSIIAGESIERSGLVNHCYGILYVELVDSNGSSVAIQGGAKGELVFTTLRREAQPLFRYRTNDIAEIQYADVADDGLLRIRFRIIGRSDDMLVIKGVNFFPQALLPLLSDYSQEIEPIYSVIRPQTPNPEKLKVVFETKLQDESRRKQLAKAIEHRVAQLYQVGISVIWLPPGSLERGDNKPKFVIPELPRMGD